jgi:predicted DNA-binding ribbon-helix-helix protein
MSKDAGDIVKRSVSIAGHRTSVSLEAPFWQALKEIACRRGVSVHSLLADLDARRSAQNLSSAIRVFVLAEVRGQPGSRSACADQPGG